MGILLVAAMIALSGCFEMPSVYPLVTDQTAIAEPRLEGAWQVKDEKEYMIIKLSGDRVYQLTYVNDSGEASRWTMRIGKLGETTIADMVPLQDDAGIPAHHFLALSLEGSGLKAWCLDSSVLREKAVKESLAFVQGKKNETIMTAPTASIAPFLQKNLADEMKKDPDIAALRLK